MQQSTLDLMQQMGHEQVVFCNDAHTGLKAIIAIHNTTLGPALGGTRLRNYVSHEEAIIDALRLSRGMTYKAAISGLNLGGGKAVIIGDAPKIKSEGLWRRYGRFVNSLNGKYITAEDVNTNTRDMEFIGMETKSVTGLPEYMGGSGDPSPMTAYGVYNGIKAAAKKVWGSDSLSGKKVLVQGAGNVGQYLMGHLTDEGAKVYVCDINESKLKAAKDKYPAIEVIPNEDIFDRHIDIYAPCALGASVNTESIAKMNCAIIAGAANNQLADENIHGAMLVKKGIVYVPDFLINAGGIINISCEVDGYNRGRAMDITEQIYTRTLTIFEHADRDNIPAHEAAMNMAEKRLKDIAAIKTGL